MERVSTGRMMVMTWCALPVALQRRKQREKREGLKERERTQREEVRREFYD
jgi:hypothetical protein